MGNEQREFEDGIGPHEDRELELMLSGQKPLAMFTEIVPIESGIVPDDEFAPHVESGRILMREVFEALPLLPGNHGDARLRRVLYAVPAEAWRIDAMLLVCRVYQRQGGWDGGLERVVGKLLGYEDWEVEAFVLKMGV